MSEFQGFVRKQFPVQAARVTPLNIHELSEACGGKVMHDGEKEGNFSRDYIKVRVAYPLNEEQTKARIGDWLVKQNRNFKVYKDKAFRNTFEMADGSPVPNHQIQQNVEVVHTSTPVKPSPASMPKKIESTPVTADVDGDHPTAHDVESESSEEAIPENPPEEETPETVVTEVAEEAEETPEEEVKTPISLDELNTMAGDPRSAQEIMTEKS